MKWALRVLALMLSVLAGAAAAEQSYPTKPIRIIVPFAPGGASDVVARLVGEKLTQALGQQVIVENRPGAAGNIGTRLAARAPADGYTLLHTSSAFLINPSLYKDAGYRIDEFTPLINIGHNCTAFVTNASVKAKTLQELLASAKSEKLYFATAGIGSTPYLAGELLFNVLAKVGATHVPYNGGAPALTAVLSGQVPVAVLTVATGSLVKHVQSGTLRVLAVTCPQRHRSLPDVPTLAEAGFPEYGSDSTWGAFFVPAGTPKDIVDKLNREIGKILELPDVRERIAAMGLDWTPNSPDEFAAQVKAEAAQWAKMVHQIGVTPQE